MSHTPQTFRLLSPGRGRQLALILAGFWLLGSLIRLTVRDLTPWTAISTLHYATPGPLLFVGGLLLTLVYWMTARGRQAASYGLLATILVTCSGTQPGSFSPPAAVQENSSDGKAATDPAPTLRLLMWNVAHLKQGLWNVTRDIKTHDADLIVLVEAGPPTQALREVWQRHFPDYELTFLGGEMLVLVRGGTAGSVEPGEFPGKGRARVVELTLQGQPLDLVVVDLNGRLTVPRKPQIDALQQMVQRRTDRPMILAGDFNTPADSLHFQTLRERFCNAYDVVGSGFQPTWPVPFPVLTLDQVWGCSRIAFQSYQATWSRASDHRAVIVNFQLAD